MDFKKQKLLVIAPHPDDEVIGCGGLIAKIKDAGGQVYVLFLTVGDSRDFTSKPLLLLCLITKTTELPLWLRMLQPGLHHIEQNIL
ncbi:MAG: hypothetical protein UU34_C0012G0018 [Candidatus Curtissbacteria bacterium GW2011_GWA1_41_11]|uniref:LmbE family protein n=1 Tax=Candidatus Curtissbacteria bacterium GW2011_GWA1_41_11 TaxID=1618409 RepID=A0A0G0WQ93_9BACT|nr:MAG: hypothetical protein UU34_C0012G0018 [Candidatus Curtissbacteria bacterium GW2011_GWA1_41_11]